MKKNSNFKIKYEMTQMPLVESHVQCTWQKDGRKKGSVPIPSISANFKQFEGFTAEKNI